MTEDSAWSPAEIDRLTLHWNAGKSGSEIGRILDRTRSAVCGKVHRLRMAGHAFTRAYIPPVEKKAVSEQRRTYGRGVTTRRPPPAPRAFKPQVVTAMLDTSNARPWIERAFGQCAYPVSGEGADTFSCCAATGGKTYCEAHRQAMFTPPKPGLAKSVLWHAGRTRAAA